MSRNYLRRCTLSLSGSTNLTVPGGGDNDLRIEFAIGASTIQTPNPGRVRITNPNKATISGFANKAFQTLNIEAGYVDNAGPIYSGDIKQSIHIHDDNIVDSYIDIFCSEHGNAYQMPHVNKTLAAGWTPKDQVQLALDAMKPYGINGLGLVNVDLSQPTHPRGGAFVSMARDLLREVALSNGATWHMQRGQVHIIDPKKPVQSGGPVVLNSRTGQVGFAHQTEGGVVVRCLINPAITVNTHIKLDEGSVVEAEKNNTPTGEASDLNINLNKAGRIAADGLYRVAYLEIEADTRGQPWYMTLTCLAAGAVLNQGQLDAGLGVGLQ